MLPGSLGKPSSMNTRSRMNAQEATPHNAPRQTNAIASSTPKELAGGKKTSGTVKAGLGPIRIRPISVAAPVATTTGRKVRLETSGSRISIANKTPPSGVLKVAAMPAPAPADRSVIVCPAEPDRLRKRRPQRRADRERRGERFDDRDDAANLAPLVEDSVHDLRNAVTLGFRRKAIHQIYDK